MGDYEFRLKYRLPLKMSGAEAAEALGAAGCTDALLGIGIAGRLALEFEREAKTAADAITSAIRDVNNAIPQAELIAAEPDLVGISEIAEIVGVSRQNVRKLLVGNSRSPLPVHDGSTVLWHLVDVLDWLTDDKGYPLNERLRETAKAAFRLNLERAISRHVHSVGADVRLANA